MTLAVKDIIRCIEEFAPPAYQEPYDNSGLLVGNPGHQIESVLITIDVTEAVIDEAIAKKTGLIIAHHPLIFSGLKQITGHNMVGRCVIKAIKNDVAIYAAHTNMDSVFGGVNSKICEKIGLKNCKVLSPVNGHLCKLVTFVPLDYAEKVRSALFKAGAGDIGNYDSCSYNVEGTGTFRGGEGTDPFVGKQGVLHHEKEVRIETVFPKHIQHTLIKRLLEAHPYEEVAFDIYPLENKYKSVGIGMAGELPEGEDELTFLKRIKEAFKCRVVRHTPLRGKKVQKVAVCGGSGSQFLPVAIAAGADIFITGDYKYHQFFDAEGKIVIADLGHYESEQFTKDVFYEILIKKFPKFALHLSEVNTNPINYLI